MQDLDFTILFCTPLMRVVLVVVLIALAISAPFILDWINGINGLN